MSIGKEFLSDLKLYTDYLKWDEKKGRYETWEEACDKVLETHILKYGEKVTPLLNEVKTSYYKKEFLVSQRNLQFRGQSIIKHNTKLYNCGVSYCNSPDVFNKGMYVLLSGVGLGINMRKEYVGMLPPIESRTQNPKSFTIPDSIEGWGEAIKVLISSYCKHPSLYSEYFKCPIKFDYSEIRPRGSEISGGFKAPGPDGLKKSIEKIEILLDSYLNGGDKKKFKSIIAYDIFMHMSDAVLSGGVRRSAMNIIMDEDDEDLLNAKVGDWYIKNPQRARSNNSVGLIRNEFTKGRFKELVNKNDGTSDLGFVFSPTKSSMYNPCLSGDVWVTTRKGPRQIKDLVGKGKVSILKDGVFYDTSETGFFETGYQPVYEIELVNGQKIKATNNHQFLTPEGWNEVENINPGDTLLISQNNENIEWEGLGGNQEEGWLIGNLIADGTYGNEAQLCYWGDNKFELKEIAYKFLKNNTSFGEDSNHKEAYNEQKDPNLNRTKIQSQGLTLLAKEWGVEKGNKTLTNLIEQGSSEFYKGILGGLFDGDGCVWDSNKAVTIDISQANLSLLERAQRMLMRFGISSTISVGNKGGMKMLPGPDFYINGELKEYECKTTYILRISNRYNVKKFFQTMFIQDQEKIEKYQSIMDTYTRPYYKPKFYSKVKSITKMGKEIVYDCAVPETGCFSANGFITHNCFEISFDFWDQIKDKNQAVFQFCNLCEINASACVDKKGKFSEDKFYELCRKASIIGTLQAGYTDFPYLGKETERIVEGEALLGVSITGWMSRPELFDEHILKKGARIVKDTNKEVAKIIGINQSARTTTVKPSGNAGVVLKTSSGCHPEPSARYFRLMQLNKDSETAKHLEATQPYLLEDSTWSSTGTDYVVYSPCENEEGTIYKADMQGVKHLELIKLIQNSWVSEGKNEELCYVPTTNHNVSNTVIMDNKKEIIDYLYEEQDNFAAVSFITMEGDKDYAQAPFTTVLNTQELIEKYGEGMIFISGLIVDGLHYFNNNLWEATNHVLDRNLKMVGTREQVLLKKDWIRRVKKYAKNYFDGNLKQTVYCMKDTHLWHKWKEITRNIQLIDYPKILTKPSFINADTLGAKSCSGGACDILD